LKPSFTLLYLPFKIFNCLVVFHRKSNNPRNVFENESVGYVQFNSKFFNLLVSSSTLLVLSLLDGFLIARIFTRVKHH